MEPAFHGAGEVGSRDGLRTAPTEQQGDANKNAMRRRVDVIERGGVAVSGIGPVQPSLEDVFLDVAERAAQS